MSTLRGRHRPVKNPALLAALVQNAGGQTAVAERVGISRQHLSRMCRGLASGTEASASKLSEALGVHDSVVFMPIDHAFDGRVAGKAPEETMQ